ncbi:MAG: hypothetical protein WDN45_15960 [Caulobacteraceae bacterium]
MKTLWNTAALAAAFVMSGAAAIAAEPTAAAVAGRWDAVLTRNGVDIPFRLDINGDGASLQGVFYDGFRPYDGTTSASFKDGKLTLNVEHYLTTINATVVDGALTGTAAAQNRETSASYTFRATRHSDVIPASNVNAPSIAGTWIIPLATPSSKGEKAFRFVAEQRGAEVAGAILRIDGDTGSYSGAFKNGKWVLSHFDGGRPGVIEVTPKGDGTLEIRQRVDRPGAAAEAASEYSAGQSDGRYAPTLTAYRQEVAEAKNLPKPEDFLTHTTARDPNEIFKFKFPDVNGKLGLQRGPGLQGQGGPGHRDRHLVSQLPRRGPVSGAAGQAVPRQGPAHRRAELRGSRTAGRPDPREGLHQEIRREVQLPARRRPGRDVGEGADLETTSTPGPPRSSSAATAR